jgi:RNA polymerase sigma-70 factor (ECF subfamily)
MSTVRNSARSAEHEEFDAWYVREHPRVVAALAAITGRPELAADAADEAFVRACERWGRVGRMASPGGWVHTTALNVARRQLRRTEHERRVVARITISPGDASPSAPEPAPDGWSPEMWTALLALPPRERQAVAWRYVAGLPVAEVAAAMGVAVGTVTSALHAARGRLAVALAPSPYAPKGASEEGVDA